MGVKRLHASRSPGNYCISSLLKDDKVTVENPINNSKGCGAVMRSAPFGLFLDKEAAFEMAAFTHGHPTGQLANDLFDVYEDSDEWWDKYPGY